MSRATFKVIHGGYEGKTRNPVRRDRPGPVGKAGQAGELEIVRNTGRESAGCASPSGHIVCPVSAGPILMHPLRRLLHDPKRLLGAYLTPGLHALEVGCGMGYFSIPIARMVGETGRLVAVDMQPGMLEALRANAEKAGVASRIEGRLCPQDSLDLSGHGGLFGFALMFMVLHEMPDAREALRQVFDALCPGGVLYLAEPGGRRAMAKYVDLARDVGFRVLSEPRVRLCRAVVLEKMAAA